MKVLSCAVHAGEALTAAGLSLDDLVSAVREKRSCASDVSLFDPDDCACQQACEVPEFSPSDFGISTRGYLDRNSEIALAAAAALFTAAGRHQENPATDDGLALGTAWGNTGSAATFRDQLQEKGPRHVSPMLFQHVYANTTASLLSIEFGLAGTHACFNSGGSASAQAIFHAITAVNDGRATHMLAGGVEALDEIIFRFMDNARLLPDGQDDSLPHIHAGEGAAFLWLGGSREKASVQILGAWDADAHQAAQAVLRKARMKAHELAWVFTDFTGQASEALRLASSGVPTERVIDIRTIIGETFGAHAAIACAAAYGCLESDERSRGILVVSSDENAGAFAFLLSNTGNAD